MIKRLLAISALALFLVGCAAIKNPVNNNAMGTAISTYGILDTAVIAYRNLPRCTVSQNFSATNICHKRSILVQAQAYDKAANAAINNAVAYQQANPTLDASSYVQAATLAVATFKDFAVTAQLPGVQ